jgi:enoyl-CoA hydratase/carnithine racemase
MSIISGSMDWTTLDYEVEGRVATISLNRPERLNAFNYVMAREIVAAFDKADADDDVRAVIVTGRGRAFCAGADLAKGAETFDYDAYAEEAASLKVGDVHRDLGGLVTLRMFDSLKPIIGAINGAAAGVGASMTLPMDIRLASTQARFGFVFARRGIAPDAAASWFLPRIVGVSQALSWAMSGRLIDAAEALRGGLVQSVHEPDQLLAHARALAEEIVAQTAPVSIAVTRRLMWDMLGAAHPMEAHKADSRAIEQLGVSADVREGVEAFLAKRPPKFVGRVTRDMPVLYPGRQAPVFR